MRKKIQVVLLSLVLCFTLLFGMSIPVQAASPKLSSTKRSMALDQTYTLTMKNTNRDVAFTSSNPGIVSVSKTAGNKARLKAISKGTATITAKIDGRNTTYQCKVTAYDPVKLSAASFKITEGQSKVVAAKNTKADVAWSSSDYSVVSLKKTSRSSTKIIAGKPGSAVVTGRIGNRRYTCKVTVSKKPEPKVKIAIVQTTSEDTASAYRAMTYLGIKPAILKKDQDISQFDGLIIPGGWDLNPKLYGQKNVRCGKISNKHDTLNWKILDRFVKAGKPVLGICRGAQLINVYFGGTLKQHISGHRNVSHQTSISPGSRLYQLYGAKYRTLSFHHQAVDKVGKGLKVVQRSTKDNVAEGIEHETLPIYGVQWHPELDYTTGKILLQDFLNRCKEYRGT